MNGNDGFQTPPNFIIHHTQIFFNQLYDLDLIYRETIEDLLEITHRHRKKIKTYNYASNNS